MSWYLHDIAAAFFSSFNIFYQWRFYEIMQDSQCNLSHDYIWMVMVEV